MTIDSKIRSLTRKQVKVLYWKCKGEKYVVIGKRHNRGTKWVQGLMTQAYRNLGVPERSTTDEALEFLKVNKICETLQELIPSPEELENWPLYGEQAVEVSKGVYTYEPKTEDDPEEVPDSEISASVISETEAEEKQNPEVDYQKQEEVELEEQLRLKEEEERLKAEAEQRKINDEADRKRREENETLKEEVARLRKAEEERLRQEKQKEEVHQGRSGTAFPNRNSRLALVFGFLLFVVCAAGVLFIRRWVSNMFAPVSTPTSDVASTQSLDTPQPTRTSELSLTPEATFTPEIQPTAIPLPISENFSQQYSKLWQVTGDPFIANSVSYLTYKGVLTTKPDETATLSIGNTAWTDNVITFRAEISPGSNDAILVLGLRVSDPNNMITFECRFENCTWVVTYNGERDVLLSDIFLNQDENVTVTVDGDSFSILGDYSDQGATSSSIILPPKYAGKFPGGGFSLKIKNVVIDFIDIKSLH